MQLVHLFPAGPWASLHWNRGPQCGRNMRGEDRLLRYPINWGSAWTEFEASLGYECQACEPESWDVGLYGNSSPSGEMMGERHITHRQCGWAHGRVSGDPGDHGREPGPHSVASEVPLAPSVPRSLGGWETAGRGRSLQRRRQAQERPWRNRNRHAQG